MRRKKIKEPPIKYRVVIGDQAKADICRYELQDKHLQKILNFLEIDACRVIAKRQKSYAPLYDIWCLRIPLYGKGTQGGGRLLYRRKGEEIFIERIFRKPEIDFAKNRRRNIFLQALGEIELKVLVENSH